MNPKYPIYIPSKGRADSRLTSKALELMGVPYRVVVEKQEYKEYANIIDPTKILILPFRDRGLVPTRNWIMEHSISEGHRRHWQIDDNIYKFYRFNRNLKVPVDSGTIFSCAEDFTDRYENVAQSGFHYFMFASRKSKLPPYYLNTRIYSCTLNNNSFNHRYRGVYNDDTDISLRLLKDGWCTILFNAFLAEKAQTMTIAGGLNTEEFYRGTNNRYEFAKELRDNHPDIVKITKKWGRWHHYVDYSSFKENKLIKKANIEIPKGIDNYGMKLINLENGQKINS